MNYLLTGDPNTVINKIVRYQSNGQPKISLDCPRQNKYRTLF